MTWIAPGVTRVREPVVADERATLDGLLEWHRATLLDKCAGLTGEQLALHPVPPSGLSLLGLIRHLAETERAWFRRRERLAVPDLYARADRPEAAFGEAAAAGAEADYAPAHRRVGTVPPGGARAATGPSVPPGPSQWGLLSLRWVFGHMITEYARHLGHADPPRECTDGATGE